MPTPLDARTRRGPGQATMEHPRISRKPWLASSLSRLETGVFDVERLEKDGFVTDDERTERMMPADGRTDGGKEGGMDPRLRH